MLPDQVGQPAPVGLDKRITIVRCVIIHSPSQLYSRIKCSVQRSHIKNLSFIKFIPELSPNLMIRPFNLHTYVGDKVHTALIWEHMSIKGMGRSVRSESHFIILILLIKRNPGPSTDGTCVH